VTERYEVRFARSAQRALSHGLPEKVGAAAFEFITGALADNPRRVGKQLQEPLFALYFARRGDYRVVYRIVESLPVIEVVTVVHRRETYRLHLIRLDSGRPALVASTVIRTVGTVKGINAGRGQVPIGLRRRGQRCITAVVARLRRGEGGP
jgi:mRNA interferase RelE/StbE